MARTAVYPGSFDPPTNGHVEVVRAAARLCDRLVIGVGVHAAKTPLLAADDRVALMRELAEPVAGDAGIHLEVRSFDGLVVAFAGMVGAGLLLRGLRDGTDLDDEMRMAGTNAGLAPGLQTVFVPASPATRHISATLVRQIAAMGGDVSPFVPASVARRLRDRFAR